MLSTIREARDKVQQSLHALLVLGQHFGVDILPRHFYSEIPDFRELRKTEAWKAPRSMYGVRGVDLDRQLSFVRDCIPDSMRAIVLEENIFDAACEENGAVGFGQVEAEFLFCFLARHKPRRIIQVGAGVSTAVLLHAGKTFDYHPEITCIDPFPTQYLRKSSENGQITLIPQKCQDVDLSVFSKLGPGDLLFVDSTHTVKPGSEVNILILEVLPRLSSGCHVHFHDIYFPYDYPCALYTIPFFWNESVLLHAFLTGNSRYSISASLSMLHHAKPKELQMLFPNYRPEVLEQGLRISSRTGWHFPTSTYLLAGEDR
ncbi:MAG: class I SAM-dependent methyltransferase [Terracidiphilus sp.]